MENNLNWFIPVMIAVIGGSVLYALKSDKNKDKIKSKTKKSRGFK